MDSLKSTKGLIMSIEFNGKTSVKHPIPETMKAWVLGNPDQLKLIFHIWLLIIFTCLE